MQVIKEPLAAGEITQLQKWLNDPACNVFIKVVESMAFECEVQAAYCATKGSEAGDKRAAVAALEAERVMFVLTLMREFKTKKDLHTSRAEPTKI